MEFRLISDFSPTGDQPEAIRQLTEGLRGGVPFQTLLGVTGSGKTFTIANVIEQLNRPVLVLSHNKTLAAQLYGEFRQFFPENAVEYFVSYYDYYQPEAYLPVTDTYIEKDLSVNDEIEKLRLSATSSLLSGRRDVIVVSSVSCIYGIGNPDDFRSNTVHVIKGARIARTLLLRRLVDSLYARNEIEFTHGTFRVRGDTVDVFPAYADLALRIVFFGEEIDEVSLFDPLTGQHREDLQEYVIYPANLFVTTRERINVAVSLIQDDMVLQAKYFRDTGRPEEAKRIEQRVQYDLEMIKELGYCSGIENYSRYFDGRAPGTRPFCLLDCFPKDFITVIDESHATIPQIRAMYGGDHSRKQTLVEYGFRLPAALDNRPLRLEEFEALTGQTIYMSATPADYELEKSEGVFVDQVIRPTGLLDPPVEVRPSRNQVDDLMEEIRNRSSAGERVLVTTMTKRMAEELNNYLSRFDIKCRYIHSDVETIERVEILEALRSGEFDVLVGVNLLREGLDLPEVSLVAILDADKEGFLRSGRALTQTAGRAARNINGLVIMYADRVTGAMKETIDETNRRRAKQTEYNKKMGITPRQIVKKGGAMLQGLTRKGVVLKAYTGPEEIDIAADPVVKYMSADQIEKAVDKTRKAMEKAAAALDFIEAARLRDEIEGLKRLAAGRR
ncbi:MAG: excinuclease ABC subunit UvrB [Bacteroidales bacterium]|jgi:excinuclease ABC subunit B|nr:excinuclease ABC subunit UvrB [Bacteroidales bacterium]NLD62441.1 excinuclease ABC subunit UvrB [Bacteroidales bacterium]HOO66280.1 excinuclease ABC subunit UvrB [Bacteroidales bacterium]HPE23250.1 excinuclease ABC subunit UvrB [Bacteroidales bacterium]HPJ04741.1 excinuclease ABC subunit UvrB [Bacteroidales bacterium]